MFECDQKDCSKICKSEKGLTQHKNKTHGIKTEHKCDLCAYKTDRKGNLTRHKQKYS